MVVMLVVAWPAGNGEGGTNQCKYALLMLAAPSGTGTSSAQHSLMIKDLSDVLMQVLIRWNINTGNSAIPKASSKGHIEDNFKPVLDLALKDHHMHKLSTYKFQMRVLDGTGAGAFPPAGPYTTLQVRKLQTEMCWLVPYLSFADS